MGDGPAGDRPAGDGPGASAAEGSPAHAGTAPAGTAGNAPHSSSEPPTASEVWRRGLELVGAFGPPLTLATALLVYFGWARAGAQARSMGLDASLFGYTVQDLVLRSIPSLYLPLVWLLVIAVGWLAADRRVRRRLDRSRVRRLALAVLPAGLALAVALWLVIMALPSLSVLYVPYALAGAVLVASWGLSLRRAARRTTSSPPAEPQRAAVVPHRDGLAVERILVFALVALLLFWGTSDYAQAVGRGLAVSVEQRVGSLPLATVYSAKRLGLSASGVTEQSMGTAEAPLFRYTGLRLLVVSGGRIFLLHDGWTLQRGRVIVLPDDSSVRVEYGTSPTGP
ncbi:hypothetical protein GCM10012320_10850 [Sinomonas cellulolyticus]|nr:hypothetical protein GCM10012320_10850 [Sinomonas sp. KCTC 49339]